MIKKFFLKIFVLIVFFCVKRYNLVSLEKQGVAADEHII